MNSRQKSFIQPIRRPCFWTVCGSFCLALGLASCATEKPTELSSAPQSVVAHFSEEITHEQEEMQPLLKSMSVPDIEPNKVREKYDEYSRRARDRFNESVRKERAEFSAGERKVRDEFLNTLNSEREAFYHTKPSPRALQEFSKNTEKKRSDYYAQERVRNASFEEKLRARQTSFTNYLFNQRTQFTNDLQNYSKAFREAEKNKAERRKAQDNLKAKARTTNGLPAGMISVPPEDNPYLKELSDWEKIPKSEGKLLKASESQ